MSGNFGPWGTGMDDGNNPQLSTFWRRRMLHLPRLSHCQVNLSNGDRRNLCAVTVLVLVMPLLIASDRLIAQVNEEQVTASRKIRGLLIGWYERVENKASTSLHEVSLKSLKLTSILKTDRPYTNLRISPDGKSVAFEEDGSVWVGNLKGESKRIFDLDPTGEHRVPKVFEFKNGKSRQVQGSNTSVSAILTWSPDGRKLIVCRKSVVKGRLGQARHYQTWRVDLENGNKTELKLKPDQYVSDWSPDGEWLLVVTGVNDSQIDMVHIDGKESLRLSGAGLNWNARFSPDGKRILFSYSGNRLAQGLHTMDLDGKNVKTIFDFQDGTIQTACWSPDGKDVVLEMSVRKRVITRSGRQASTHGGSLVYLVGKDGENVREVELPEGVTPAFLEWR